MDRSSSSPRHPSENPEPGRPRTLRDSPGWWAVPVLLAEDWSDGDPCAACHGVDHLGTRLAQAPVARELRDAEGRLWTTVVAGQMIACNLCHELDDSFPGD